MDHPAVAQMNTPHMKYWGEVKEKAEECVEHVLMGGNHKVTLHEAIGKKEMEHPEDWDALMDYCKGHGASCGNMNLLYRAQVSWMQAYNEIHYKMEYPG